MKGFTLIETIITLSLVLMAISLFYINFSRLPSSNNLILAQTKLVSDIKRQQAMSMNGSAASIILATNSYTLLPQNQIVSSEDGIEISVNDFASSTIEFEIKSGDIKDYVIGGDNLTLIDTILGESKVIRLNKYATTY